MDGNGLMKMVHDAARHAAARQAQIARNVANADTPGYRAQGIGSFADTLREPVTPLRRTRPGHLPPTDGGIGATRATPRASAASPNGNTVSLETEMMHATAAKAEHDTALSIYSSARQILGATLGRR
ncbi:FlgB family protein [Palleronia pelagia]|uniref:Flagellar basal body rod protein FlgB n=1 Tax=Palleronia pelagia TaxID=387096 RepID=A0A1H8L5N6_9RHOB|nr:FlgB family protein [Palleronia pelagia]SEO00399.1 flagellar basal-body rod protein FlgB [Palleronia pelagia]